jgi:hypothetical protein
LVNGTLDVHPPFVPGAGTVLAAADAIGTTASPTLSSTTAYRFMDPPYVGSIDAILGRAAAPVQFWRRTVDDASGRGKMWGSQATVRA